MEEPILLNDNDIARTLKVSPEWVRQQRMLRKHGKPHVLEIDAVYIGTRPRYVAAEFHEWLDKRLGGGRQHPNVADAVVP